MKDIAQERSKKILKLYHSAMECIACMEMEDHRGMDTVEYWLQEGRTREDLAEQLAMDTKVARGSLRYAMEVELGAHDNEPDEDDE